MCYNIADAFESFPNFAASTSLSNITLKWKAPLDDMWYQMLYTYMSNATSLTVSSCETETMFKVVDLAPGTNVKFTITALTDCGAVGQTSIVKSTDAIREFGSMHKRCRS